MSPKQTPAARVHVFEFVLFDLTEAIELSVCNENASISMELRTLTKIAKSSLSREQPERGEANGVSPALLKWRGAPCSRLTVHFRRHPLALRYSHPSGKEGLRSQQNVPIWSFRGVCRAAFLLSVGKHNELIPTCKSRGAR
ncbi:hypothetical protein AG1IA_04737 [Rhizoctonia solani AG-1 IA]|uniref:Uncharacterized protein n=1 Tax=Thanatephorus cucumeris (strain AG1-IA) TaxID=983506 RepID=L8WTC7_THACA|nr:hypothetical protein AG1IA_04737 [Rhizoctonia solani AG-1 IA]